MGKHFLSKNELIYEDLLAFINKNGYGPGDKLPPERQLAEMMGVSRTTLRYAIERAIANQNIVSKHGVGNIVTPTQLCEDAKSFLSFSKGWQADGFKIKNDVLTCKKEKASEKVAPLLQINVNDEVFVLKRVRYLDDDPIIIETAYIPYNLCPGIEKHDFSKSSLYSTLENEYNVYPINQAQTYSLTFLTKPEANLLKTDDKKPAFHVKGITYDSNKRVIEYSTSINRADRYSVYAWLDVEDNQ